MASFIAPILGGLLGGLGGLFGGNATKNVNSSQNNSGTSSSQTQNYGTTSPNLSPLQSMLSNMFGGQAAALSQQDPNLTGYTAQGLQNINQSTNAASKNVSNQLASRGLSFSPYAATAMAQPQIAAAGQQSNFLSSIPLLQRSLQQQNIAGLESAFSALPTGTTSTSGGNTNQQQQSSMNGVNIQSTPGGGVAGGISGLGGGLIAGLGLNKMFPGLFGSQNAAPFGSLSVQD